MSKLLRSFAAFVVILLAAGHALAAPSASFNSATSRLTMSRVDLSDNTAFTDVVIRIVDFGTIAVDDTSVGDKIAFDLKTFTLRLPSVAVDGTPFNKVSLTGVEFIVESVGVQVDAGTSGGYDLDLAISVVGFPSLPMPAMRIENVPKPANQAEFCASDVSAQIEAQIRATYSSVSGSWSMTGCSFNGTVGSISGRLMITSPITMNMDFSVTGTYTPR